MRKAFTFSNSTLYLYRCHCIPPYTQSHNRGPTTPALPPIALPIALGRTPHPIPSCLLTSHPYLWIGTLGIECPLRMTYANEVTRQGSRADANCIVGISIRPLPPYTSDTYLDWSVYWRFLTWSELIFLE